MRDVAIPELKFSKWYAWENRTRYPLVDYPGVYLISISSNSHLEGQEPRFEDVVYIGMTKSKNGLRGRWQQFFNAIKGREGHSGGKTVYRDKGHYSTWPDYLYVAAMGVKCDVINPTDHDYIRMGWVVYLECEAFAQYYQRVGGHPKYNTL